MIRCPECSAEIDVDEDEVEEGEILSCPECESELEVSQTHPVHLNLIADDMDEDLLRSRCHPTCREQHKCIASSGS